MFAKFAKPLKDLKKKTKEIKKEKTLKKQKVLVDHIGHRKPMAGSDKKYERSLKIGCVKGVVRVFNAIINFQKNDKEQ